MNIAVCVKQIPDPATPYDLDPEHHWVIRPDDQVLDDTDRSGVEIALQLAEATEGTVTLFSMSPSGSMQGIRQALAMGADKAVIVDDAALKGSDALTTARVLAAAMTMEGFDLVVAGTESTDGYSGVMPQMMSELLDVPCLSFARRVEARDGSVTIERQTANGYDVVVSAAPALITVTAGIEPRYPTFKGIMQAKSKPVTTLTLADLGIDPDSGQVVRSVDPVAAREAGEIIEDEGEAHLRIVEVLEQAKVV
ncbi:MAG: electron transfer flavoprotein subunit beta/FixA family protein [Acidimicrobiia bacterium]